jgi:hypothetical protein
MATIYTIPTRALRAAIGCAATLDARNYLKCIRVAAMAGTGGVMLQATDGMLAAVIYCGEESKAATDGEVCEPVLLPVAELKAALTHVSARRAGCVCVDASGTVSVGAVSASVMPSAARYPDLAPVFESAADYGDTPRMASSLDVYVKLLAAAGALRGFAPRKAAGAQMEHCNAALRRGDGWTVSDGVERGVRMIAATTRREAKHVEDTHPSLAQFAGWPIAD